MLFEARTWDLKATLKLPTRVKKKEPVLIFMLVWSG